MVVAQRAGWGLPGGPVDKNLPANVGDTGSTPGLGPCTRKSATVYMKMESEDTGSRWGEHEVG